MKSTGGAAGVTASQVNSLSDSIEKKSLLDAEAIQSGQNLLLTFTNIKNEAGKGNDIFNQTTQAMADLATAMGSSPESAAKQLGKALNDPAKGLTALTRSGVTFTDAQKEQIKAMQEAGNTAGAQKIILAELSKEFGGSAEAAGNTAAGQFKHFKDTIDNVFESIVRKAIPVLLAIVTYLNTNLPKALAASQPYIDKFKAAFDAIKPVLQAVFEFMANNKGVVIAFAATIGVVTAAVAILNAVLALNPVTLIVIALAALVAGLVYAYQNFTTFRNVVNAVFKFLKTATQATFPVIKQIILVAFKVISTYVKVYIKVISTVIKVAWAVIKVVTKAAWAYIKTNVVEPVKAIVNFVKTAGPAVKNAITTAWNAVKNATKTAWNAVKTAVTNAVTSLVNKVQEIKGKVTGALSGAGTLLLEAGKAIIQGLIDGIQQMFGKLQSKLKEVTDKLPDWKGPMSKDKVLLRKNGQVIMQSLIDGFALGEAGVEASLGQLTDLIEKTLTKKLSKKFKGDKLKEVLAERMKEVLGKFAKEFKALKQQGKAIDASTQAIKDQQDALAALQQQAADYATTVRDAFADFGNITSLDSAFNANSLINALKERLAKAQKFAAVVQQLIAMNINATTLQQIIGAGVEGGLAVAEALAAGGSGAVAEVNSIQAELQAAGQALGNNAANSMYGAGIQAAQGLLNGLLANEKELKAVAKALGAALVKAIKRELGINSPSRVFKAIGEFTVSGLAAGLANTRPIEKAASGMTAAIEKGYSQPNLSAGTGGKGDTFNITVEVDNSMTTEQMGRAMEKAINAALTLKGKKLAYANA